MAGTSLASLSRPFWRLLESYSIEPEFVFREAGLDPDLMVESRARYDAKDVDAAWAKASDLIEDPCFGLRIANYWAPTDFHALGYSFLASRTLDTALRRLVRYVYVVDNVVGFELKDDGEYITLVLKIADQHLTQAAEDATWAMTLSVCRAGYGDKLEPSRVRLRHRKPSCQQEYQNFFRCPVQFAAEEFAIVFNRDVINRPLPAPNRELARINDQALTNYLKNLSKSNFVNQLKTAIADELPSGKPRADKLAKKFHLSLRSLRRRLATEGASYTGLLDAVREGLAKQYIADSDLDLNEIAFLLGFSEMSAFSRAFKRWTGESPSKFREMMSG